MAKTLARVAAPDGIPVNIVAPGHVEKDKAIGTDAAAARRASVAARVPMGRIATPADIVGPILFLLSPDAGYLTGDDPARGRGFGDAVNRHASCDCDTKTATDRPCAAVNEASLC